MSKMKSWADKQLAAQTSGRKDDQSKADLSLIPLSALEAEARGFMHGAAKYGRDNYKGGMASHRLVAACLRHVLAWERGEDRDPESGVSHLGHARCCLAMLLELQRLSRLVDTRWDEDSVCINPEPQRADLEQPFTQEELDEIGLWCGVPSGAELPAAALTDAEVQRLFWEGL